MSLQITTQPSSEPVTLAEVKARLRLTTTSDDATITQNITAAREFAEIVTRQSLALKTYAYFMDRFPLYPREPIRIPAPPLGEVLAVKFLDDTLTWQTWATDDYFVAGNQSPALIVPLPGIIYPPTGAVPGAVEIDFTAGYDGTCPENIKEGIRQLAVHIYEHPEAVTSEGLKEAPLALMSFLKSKKVYVF